MLEEKPPLADARGDSPKANMGVVLLEDIVFDRADDMTRQLLCIVKQQARQIEKLEARIDEQDRRMDALSRRQTLLADRFEPAALRDKTAQDHLDRLFSEMRRLGLHQVAITDAARILAISKRQMANVKPSIKSDPRFALVIDPKIHKQRHLIRIV